MREHLPGLEEDDLDHLFEHSLERAVLPLNVLLLEPNSKSAMFILPRERLDYLVPNLIDCDGTFNGIATLRLPVVPDT